MYNKIEHLRTGAYTQATRNSIHLLLIKKICEINLQVNAS